MGKTKLSNTDGSEQADTSITEGAMDAPLEEFTRLPVLVDEKSPNALTRLSVKALLKLIRAGKAELFVDAEEKVCVAKVAKKGRRSQIRRLNHNELELLLRRAVRYLRMRKDQIVEVLPPPHVVQDIMHSPDKPFPRLLHVFAAPFFSKQLRYCSRPGYHPEIEAIIDIPSGVKPRPLPKNVSQDDIAEARRILRTILRDFPFATRADRTNALALAITLIVRFAIEGPVPMFAFSKPSPGSGGTLLVLALVLAALGYSPTPQTEPKTDAEWKKTLFATLRKGGLVAFLDNVVAQLKADALCSILTAYPTYSDRVLGVSQMAEVDAELVWVVTGNSVRMTAEVARRVVPIVLDPGVEDPLLRRPEGREFLDLRSYIPEHQADFWWALAVLVKGWRKAGRPAPSGPTLPMFERWHSIVGGVLEHAGYKDFLANFKVLVDSSADTATEFLAEIMPVWFDEFGEKPVRARDLVTMLESRELPTLPSDHPRTGEASKQLGTFLSKHHLRVVHGWKLLRQSPRGGVATFCLQSQPAGGSANSRTDS
jgi:hypothetical protein